MENKKYYTLESLKKLVKFIELHNQDKFYIEGKEFHIEYMENGESKHFADFLEEWKPCLTKKQIMEVFGLEEDTTIYVDFANEQWTTEGSRENVEGKLEYHIPDWLSNHIDLNTLSDVANDWMNENFYEFDLSDYEEDQEIKDFDITIEDLEQINKVGSSEIAEDITNY